MIYRSIRATLGLLSLLALTASVAWPQPAAHGLDVRPLTTDLRQAHPGSISTMSFRTINRSEQTREFSEAIELPAGWRVLSPPRSFELAPSEDHLRILAFSVPRSAEAGIYEIGYLVRALDDYAITAAASLSVQVTTVRRMRMEVEQAPSLLIAGESTDAILRLVNEGNSARSVRISAEDGGEGLSLEVTPEEFDVVAGGFANITVRLTAARAARGGRTTVPIRVWSADDPAAAPLASAGFAVEVVPVIAGTAAREHRFPMALTLMLTGDSESSGFQAQLQGKGDLSPRGRSSLELLARGPDQQHTGTFGLRDEWRVAYASEGFALTVGDQTAGLSLLTDPHRYGRGIAAQGALSPDWRVGGYTLSGRAFSDDDEQTGAWVAHSVSERTDLRINHLLRDSVHGGDRAVSSLEAHHRAGASWELEGEVGASTGDGSGAAWRLQARGEIARDSYLAASTIHASSNYMGYYSGIDSSSFSLSRRLGDRTTVRAGYRRWEGDPRVTAEGAIAPSERLRQISVGHGLSSRWHAGLMLEDYRRRDTAQPVDFSYEDRAVRLTLDRAFPNGSIRAEFRAAERSDRLTGLTSSSEQLRLFGMWRRDSNHSLSLFTTLSGDDRDRGARLLSGGSNTGASLAWRFSDEICADFSYQRYGGFASSWSSDQMSGRVKYAGRDGIDAFAEVRTNQHAAGEKNTAWAVGVTLPFDLTLGSDQAAGLCGRVYDALSDGREGIAGVVVRLDGMAAVTDATGCFRFRNLLPGRGHLSVERSSIPAGSISMKPMPIEIEISPDGTEPLDIGLTKRASLRGRLQVSKPDAPDSGVIVGSPGDGSMPKLSNLTVEIRNEDEVLRRYTDSNGAFEFECVRPGSWQLRVDHRELPAYYEFGRAEWTVDLRAGQSEELAIPVLPRVRRIRMIDEGAVGGG